MRLLRCHDCNTIDHLPDYEGTDPNYDFALIDVIERFHKFPNGEPHMGSPLMQMDQKTYDKIAAAGRVDKAVFGIELEARALRDCYKDDANTCFNKHGRPEMGCIDFHDDSKRIGNPAGRGLPAEARAILSAKGATYICDYCPVSAFVATEIRHKRGMYK